MRFVPAVLLLTIAACSGDAGGPDHDDHRAPAIVKLLVADPDTGFWLGESLTLSSLIVGAVNSDGDTVAAPPVTWTIPAGFVRSGDSLKATREARGSLIVTAQPVSASADASFASETAPQVSATIQASTITDLASREPWSSEQRCYNSPTAMRDVESPPIGIDSSIITRFNGTMAYSATDWADVFRATISVDELVLVFWKDGVVDTTFNRTAIIAAQDTLAVALGSNIGSAAPWMRRVSDAPIVYRLDPPGVCSGDWLGPDGIADNEEPGQPGYPPDGGTAFELRAP